MQQPILPSEGVKRGCQRVSREALSAWDKVSPSGPSTGRRGEGLLRPFQWRVPRAPQQRMALECWPGKGGGEATAAIEPTRSQHSFSSWEGPQALWEGGKQLWLPIKGGHCHDLPIIIKKDAGLWEGHCGQDRPAWTAVLVEKALPVQVLHTPSSGKQPFPQQLALSQGCQPDYNQPGVAGLA